jgi:hypothetical protein
VRAEQGVAAERLDRGDFAVQKQEKRLPDLSASSGGRLNSTLGGGFSDT